MKLARPYRRPPLAIAAALAAELAAEAADGPGHARSPRPRSRRPGFLNLRLSRRAPSSATIAGDPRRPAGLGPGRRRRSRASVNVEFVSANPTGPAARSATPAARSSATCCAGSSRPAASRSRASTTSTTRAARSSNLGASVARAPARRAGPRGRLPRRLRRRPRRRAARTTSGRGRRRAGADADGIVGRWAAGRVRDGHRGEPRAPRRPVRRLDERGARSTTRAGSSGRSSACASAATSTSRTARSGSARPTFGDDKDRVDLSARTASRPTSPPTSATSPRSSAAASTTSSTSGAPTTTGRSPASRNAAEAMGYDRDAVQMLLYSLGPLRPRRRGGLDVQAGRRVHHPRRAARPRSGSTPPAGSSPHAAPTIEHRLRHRAGQEAVEREPGLLRPVRPRPDRLDPAQGGRRRAGARRRRSTGALGGRARGGPGPRDRPASRRSSRTPSRPRRRTASPPTRPSSRRRSTRFYRDARVVDADEPERSAARLALADGGADRRSRTRSACSGSPRPSRCRRPASRPRPELAGQAEHAGGLSQRRVVRRSATQRVVPPSPGRTCADAAGLARARSSRPSRTRSRRRRCPRRSASRRPMRRRALEDAPAGRRPSRPPPASASAARRRRRSRASQIAELELAERVLERRRVQPCPSRVARSAGSVDVDRRLVGWRTSRGGGSARSTAGGLANAASTAGQPPVHLQPLSTKTEPVVYGKSRSRARIGGICRERLPGRPGRCRRPTSSPELGRAQVLLAPSGSSQRRVALDERLPGERRSLWSWSVRAGTLETSKFWSWSAWVYSWE